MIIKCWSLLFNFSKYSSLSHRCILTVPCVTGGTPVSTHNPSPTSKYIYYLFQVSKAAITKHNKPEAKMTEIFSFPVPEAETRKINCLQSMELLSALGSNKSYVLQVMVVSSDPYSIRPIYMIFCVVTLLGCSPLCSLRS